MCLTLLSLMALSSMFNTWVRKLRPDSLYFSQGHKHTVHSLVSVRSVLHAESVNDWLNFGILFLILIHQCYLHLVPFHCTFPFLLISFLSFPILFNLISFPFFFSCPFLLISFFPFLFNFLLLFFSLYFFHFLSCHFFVQFFSSLSFLSIPFPILFLSFLSFPFLSLSCHLSFPVSLFPSF